MLKGIDPILSPELLFVLAAMGHGDELAIVDANFPAASIARKLIRMDGASASHILEAVLTLLPLDDFVNSPVSAMQPSDDRDAIPEPVREFQLLVDTAEHRSIHITRIDRFEFYDRTRAAFAVVATGERRLCGNVLLKKGIIRPS